MSFALVDDLQRLRFVTLELQLLRRLAVEAVGKFARVSDLTSQRQIDQLVRNFSQRLAISRLDISLFERANDGLLEKPGLGRIFVSERGADGQLFQSLSIWVP